MIKLHRSPDNKPVWVNLSTLAYMTAERRLGQNEDATTLTWPTQHTLLVKESPEEIDGITELGI